MKLLAALSLFGLLHPAVSFGTFGAIGGQLMSAGQSYMMGPCGVAKLTPIVAACTAQLQNNSLPRGTRLCVGKCGTFMKEHGRKCACTSKQAGVVSTTACADDDTALATALAGSMGSNTKCKDVKSYCSVSMTATFCPLTCGTCAAASKADACTGAQVNNPMTKILRPFFDTYEKICATAPTLAGLVGAMCKSPDASKCMGDCMPCMTCANPNMAQTAGCKAKMTTCLACGKCSKYIGCLAVAPPTAEGVGATTAPPTAKPKTTKAPTAWPTDAPTATVDGSWSSQGALN